MWNQISWDIDDHIVSCYLSTKTMNLSAYILKYSFWVQFCFHSDIIDFYLNPLAVTTRTPRMPAFWGYPLPPHDYPYYWVILDPKSKADKVKVTNLKNSPKFQILKQTLHTTHLLNLWFCPQTDRRKRWNQYTALSTSLKLGVITLWTLMQWCHKTTMWKIKNVMIFAKYQ